MNKDVSGSFRDFIGNRNVTAILITLADIAWRYVCYVSGGVRGRYALAEV